MSDWLASSSVESSNPADVVGSPAWLQQWETWAQKQPKDRSLPLSESWEVFWEVWPVLTSEVRQCDVTEVPWTEDRRVEKLCGFLHGWLPRLPWDTPARQQVLLELLKQRGALFETFRPDVCPDGESAVVDAVWRSQEIQTAFDLPEGEWNWLLTQGTAQGRGHALLAALTLPQPSVTLVKRLEQVEADRETPLPVAAVLATLDETVSHAERVEKWDSIVWYRGKRDRWVQAVENALTETRWSPQVHHRLVEGCRAVRPRIGEARFRAEDRHLALTSTSTSTDRAPRIRPRG